VRNEHLTLPTYFRLGSELRLREQRMGRGRAVAVCPAACVAYGEPRSGGHALSSFSSSLTHDTGFISTGSCNENGCQKSSLLSSRQRDVCCCTFYTSLSWNVTSDSPQTTLISIARRIPKSGLMYTVQNNVAMIQLCVHCSRILGSQTGHIKGQQKYTCRKRIANKGTLW
jgi:hypothetical protein